MSDPIPWAQLVQQAPPSAPGSGGPRPLLGPGTYDVVVKKATAKRTKDNTKDQLFVIFEVTTGPKAGQTAVTNLTLSPNNDQALTIFFQQMEVFGITREIFAAHQPTFEILAQWLLTKPCQIVVTAGSYNGQPKDEVTYINPPGSAPTATVPPMPATAQPQQPGYPPLQAVPAPAPAPQAPVPQAPPAQQWPPAAPQAPQAPVPPVPQPPVPAPAAPAPVPTAPPAPFTQQAVPQPAPAPAVPPGEPV